MTLFLIAVSYFFGYFVAGRRISAEIKNKNRFRIGRCVYRAYLLVDLNKKESKETPKAILEAERK